MKKIKIKQNENPVETFSTMGCRTINGSDINFADVYKQNIQSVLNYNDIKFDIRSSAQKDGRGNICPVTIILPTIAMESKKDPKIFLKNLDKKIHEAKDMLIERYKIIYSQPHKAAKFMWDNHTMAGYDGQNPISALQHGTLVIGQLGLAETLQILLGCDQTDPKGMELAKQIEELFNKRCNEFKKEYSLNFGVYYTPAENLCYTAMKKFQHKYGKLKNISDHDYFTNSIHVPVWKQLNPFEKIDIESQLTGYSNAGCITYVELPSSAEHNIDALETLVNYAMNKDIPYFAINIPNDHCENCGYTGELGEHCIKCGSNKIKRLRRVTGYLSTDYRNFNLGKQQEVEDRVKHITQ